MNIKSVSRICGALYISTILASMVSNFILKGLINSEDISNTLSILAENVFRYRFAVSLDFLGMVAVMSLAFSLYTILKPINAYLAFLALGWRIGEVVLQAGAKIPDYLLLTLSQSTITSNGTDLAGTDMIGQVLIAGSAQAVWASLVFFSIGSLFNNFLFYKGKVIPSLLAVFGVISTVLYLLGSILALFIDLPESANMVLMFPLVLFELSLGFYLVIFGVKEVTS